MRSNRLFSSSLVVLLGIVLVVAGHDGYWNLLHLVLCMSAAITILYVSHTRSEYLWLGALGGVALILAPLNPAVTVTGPLWPDLICVAVFVAYYKLFITRSRISNPARGGQGGGQRAR